MAKLADKKIIVALSGSIAAYKAPILVRRLKEQLAEVKVVMTESAKAFITPLTLQAVSGNPVHDSLLDPQAEAAMGHIELARWADLIVIAPATAEIIAKLSHGHANDLLSTLCLATPSPIAIAPAMNQQMWKHWAVQENIQRLEKHDVRILGPGQGEQACGDVGEGTVLEPEDIVAEIEQFFAK